MISYYELLGMIKEDKAPNKIRVHLNSQPRIYKKDDDTEEYCYYVLENEKEENGNYQYYLMESYMESMIFDETIEILEEEKKIPEKFDNYEINSELNTSIKCETLRQYFEMLCDSYNQLLDYLKSKGE